MLRFYYGLFIGIFIFPSLYGVRTQSVIHETYTDFIEGDFINVSLGHQGSLRLAPTITEIAELQEPIVWSAVVDSLGHLYLATGNNGKVIKVSPQGESVDYFSPEKILTRAIAIDPQDNLYVGTSPRGRIFRIAPDGLPEIYFNTEEEYIWDLIFNDKGDLFVATGNPAKIYRLPANLQSGSEAEVWFTCPQTHLTQLDWDANGHLLAGSSPEGILYRIEGKDKVYALYNTGSQEIKAITANRDGSILFSTFNRSVNSKNTQSSPVSDSSNTLPAYSVKVSSSDSNSNNAPKSNDQGSSRIYKIDSEGFVDPYWETLNFNIYSLIRFADNNWLIGTNDKGRLYSVVNRNEWSLLQQAPDGGELTVLIPDPMHHESVLAITSNPAKIYRLQVDVAGTGVYTSDVIDAQQIVRWGNLLPVTDSPLVSPTSFRTRSGNTDKPDDTWNDWIDVIKNAENWELKSPNARYLQYEITFGSDSDSSHNADAISSIRIFHQSRNTAPYFEAIRLLPVGLELIQAPTVMRNIDLVKLLDEKDPNKFISTRKPRMQLKQMGEEGLISVGWKAVDPNGDAMEFSLLIKKDGTASWIKLVEELEEPIATINTKGFDEGNYHLKVVASDAPDNEAGQELEGFLVSEHFLIDNSPPSISILKKEWRKKKMHLHLKVSDKHSILMEFYYQLDGKLNKSIRPIDGLFDSKSESFNLELSNLKPGKHSLLLEAYDETGNAGVLTVPLDTRF